MRSRQQWILTFRALFFGLLLAWAPGAGAQEREEDVEVFRQELLGYFSDLEALPVSLLEAFSDEPVAIYESRSAVQQMSHEELVQLRAALEQVPHWRALPGVLATSLPTEEYFSPLELAARVDVDQALLDSHRSRQQLLDLLAMFERLPARLPAGSLSPDHRQRVAALRTRIEGLDVGQRVTLRRAINARSSMWADKIRSAQAAHRPRSAFSGGALDNAASGNAAVDTKACPSFPTPGSCTQDFPADILCEIENIIDGISGIPCRVGEFAEDAGDFIIEQLVALLGAIEDLLPTVDEIRELIEPVLLSTFKNSEWYIDIFPGRRELLQQKGIRAVDAVAAIPCPLPFGDAVGDFPENPDLGVLDVLMFGDYGDPKAAITCRRRYNFLPSAVLDLIPKDSLSVAAKVAVIIGNVVMVAVDYLCLCYESAAAIKLCDEQEVHRKFVARRFCQADTSDEDCENWSVVKNCDTFLGCVDNDNADSQRDERFIKISDLGTNGGDTCDAGEESSFVCIDDEVTTISDAVGVLQTSIDGVNDDLTTLDGDVAKVAEKLDAGLANSDQTAADLSDFRDLALQLRIESDLIRDGDDRIALFQLPSSVGGSIELVAEILADAIEQRELAGRDVGNARFYLSRGDDLFRQDAYKKAYTEYRQAYRELVQTTN